MGFRGFGILVLLYVWIRFVALESSRSSKHQYRGFQGVGQVRNLELIVRDQRLRFQGVPVVLAVILRARLAGSMHECMYWTSAYTYGCTYA